MNISTLGIDLAKNVFYLVALDARHQVVVRKKLSRQQLFPYIANLPTCTIGMEACSGAHHWARLFKQEGHRIKIIAAKFVAPLRRGVKNDWNDAKAIAEAAEREDTPTVSEKTLEQQALLSLHRARDLATKERTATINQVRGILMEFGLVIASGRRSFCRRISEVLEDGENGLPSLVRQTLNILWEQVRQADGRVKSFDRELEGYARENDVVQRLLTIPGVGVLTATATVASIGNPRCFKNGRQLAAWLGLTPRQHTTGGKIKLGRITKQGNGYLRRCFTLGAKALLTRVKSLSKEDRNMDWYEKVIERRGRGRGVVAMAARNVRLVWTLLIKNEDYRRVGV